MAHYLEFSKSASLHHLPAFPQNPLGKGREAQSGHTLPGQEVPKGKVAPSHARRAGPEEPLQSKPPPPRELGAWPLPVVKRASGSQSPSGRLLEALQ